MKIKFGTDDNLPLNKPLKLHLLTIIVRCIFEEDSKFYPQHYLDDCLYELYKCCSTKKMMFQKKLTPIKQTQFMFCHYWYFKNVGFKFEPHVCNKCHDVLMTAYELKNSAILNVKGVHFRCILWGTSRNEAVNRLNNSALDNKGVS